MPKIIEGNGQPTEDTSKPPITVACCMPVQKLTPEDKFRWLDETLAATPCDLFLLPQEFL